MKKVARSLGRILFFASYFTAIGIAVLFFVYGAGKVVFHPAPTPTPTPSQESSNPFASIQEVWGLIHNQYAGGPIDNLTLERGAITGMLAALNDPNTAYIPPVKTTQAQIRITGEYEGIGAQVAAVNGELVFSQVQRYSPAEKAGLKAGDRLVRIDDQTAAGLTADEAFNKLTGSVGSTVSIEIVPAGKTEPVTLKISRDHIVVPSVDSRMLDHDILLLEIWSFDEQTPQQVHQVLETAIAQKTQGIILDLRGNPGGVLDSAVTVAGEFLGKKVIMIENLNGGKTQDWTSTNVGIALKIPLAILVDQNTASASEVLAGAIQDYGRGTLVGHTTYGKGTLQNWTPLKTDEGMVRITIASWATPNGHAIEKVGLTPDIPVDSEEGQDSQLQAAINKLQSLIGIKS
jgi:C-terminal peptidase (prc)